LLVVPALGDVFPGEMNDGINADQAVAIDFAFERLPADLRAAGRTRKAHDFVPGGRQKRTELPAHETAQSAHENFHRSRLPVLALLINGSDVISS
jgi:hypothetical protein